MRQYFEDLERKTLAGYAVKSCDSQGRRYPEPPSPNRTCFQRDRDRIIHSKAFRRLKHKTQVFVATKSDHYRSRLTHTLEVAAISRHLARLFKLNEDLSESIALAHDLGHTPFGHSGEDKLNALMTDYGGFEHNKQSLRIVDLLETKYPQFPGLNLSQEVREGLMKHSTPYDQPDQPPSHTSLEAQTANIADEIAYNNHDLDDGLTAGILDHVTLEKNVELWRRAKEHIRATYIDLSNDEMKYLINSYLITSQIMDVSTTSSQKLKASGIHSIADVKAHPEGDRIISFSAEMKELNRQLRRFLFDTFYSHFTVYRANMKGQLVIEKLFSAFCQDTRLLPTDVQNRISDKATLQRVVADYIAGMTDTYAQSEYQTIYATP